MNQEILSKSTLPHVHIHAYELVGLSKNYIGDLERGEKEPTISTLNKIALKLGRNASRIIKDAGY